jgi:4-amino-4-deoxy-L-arabinose transferase-like glycosyltransferase
LVFWFAAALTMLTHGAYWALDHERYAIDTPTYLIPADNLAHGLGFVNEEHKPELRRTPGYPVVLAIFRSWPLRVEYLIVAQHLLCALIAGGVALIGWRLSGSRVVPFVVAAVLALDLATVRIANLLMTEVMAMVLLSLAAWSLYRGMMRPVGRVWWITAAGLLGGCAALVRPVGSLYFVALSICLILELRRRALRPVMVLTVSFLLLPVVWATRNYVEGRYFGISTIGAEDILYYRAAGALGIQQSGSYLENTRRMNGIFINQTCADLERSYRHDCSSVTEAQRSSYATRKGISIILSNPFSYVRSVSVSLAYIIFGGGAEALSKISSVGPRMAESIVLLITVPEALLAIAGCWYWYRRDRNLFYVLVLTVGYFFLLSAGAEAYSRFRVPVMPMYALLAGGGAAWMVQTIRRPASQIEARS